jgi:hypothetical protein
VVLVLGEISERRVLLLGRRTMHLAERPREHLLPSLHRQGVPGPWIGPARMRTSVTVSATTWLVTTKSASGRVRERSKISSTRLWFDVGGVDECEEKAGVEEDHSCGAP